MNLIFKQLPALLLLAVLAISPLAHATPAPGTVRIVLRGLVCAYCAHGLTQRLRLRPELESIQVRLGNHDAILKLKPNAQVPESELRQAASDAGLQIERIEYPTES